MQLPRSHLVSNQCWTTYFPVLLSYFVLWVITRNTKVIHENAGFECGLPECRHRLSLVDRINHDEINDKSLPSPTSTVVTATLHQIATFGIKITLQHGKYLYKTSTFVFSILTAIKWADFHFSSTVSTEFIPFDFSWLELLKPAKWILHFVFWASNLSQG